MNNNESLEAFVARIAATPPLDIEVDDPCVTCLHTWEPTDPTPEPRMTNVIPSHTTNALTMTSREIAELTGKRHDHVLRDIDALTKKLDPELGLGFQSSTYQDPTGKSNRQFELDRDSTMCLVAGYAANVRMRIIKRWQELEAAHATPKATDPVIGALVHGLMEIDALKQKAVALDHKTDALENRVKLVEMQHRSGVPVGYVSKKQAHHLYGEGLSEEIFHLAMAKRSVPIKNYIHRGEDGYEVATFAYQEHAIQGAVDYLIADAEQVTPQLCQSPMLSGKRFRYVKEASA